MRKDIVLTGDRPTGRLHLGHYVGSLMKRVELQATHQCYIIIADFQVLIDHLDDTHEVTKNIREIVLDYLAVGIDPQLTTIFVQSAVPELTDLAMYLSMLTSVAELRRNPTIKVEAERIGVNSLEDKIAVGFLGYPVSQAADILLFRADLVPAGEDQRPHLELSQDLARRFNRRFGRVFPVPDLLVSNTPRLPGLVGGAKMSKSLGNAIYLSDPAAEVEQKVKTATTDPNKARRTDPGHPEVCRVFSYHKAFDPDHAAEVEATCRAGQVGCMDCKMSLVGKLNAILNPIRDVREQLSSGSHESIIRDTLQAGTAAARRAGQETMELVREAVGYQHKTLLVP